MNRTGVRPARQSRATTILFALSLVTLFLLTHPYRGIWYDASLYTAQAVRDAHPAHFTHDLFFQFGSQDDWTLFGKLYEKLIGLIGIRAGNLVGLAVAQGLWWAGMWRLSKRLLPAPWHWVCLLLVASMPAYYGDAFLLSYNEVLLTARLPAEALCLWALAFALEDRRIVALAIAVVAMTIHPLIGAVGFAAVLITAAPAFPWWRLLAAMLPVFAISQFLVPSSWAIHPFDLAWMRVVRTEVSFLFPTEWDLGSWSKACWVLALPSLLAAVDTAERRRLWASLTLIGFAGVVASALADLAGHDAFWTQVQPWRVLWLLSAMQWAAVATIVHREWRERPALLWLLAICWLGLEYLGGGFIALAIAGLAHVERAMKSRGTQVAFFTKLSALYKTCLVVVTLVAAAFGVLFQVLFSHVLASVWSVKLNLDIPWLEAVIHTRLMVLLVVAISGALLVRSQSGLIVLCPLLALLGGYAIVNFDQRLPTIKIMEANLDAPERAPFVGRVPPGQMVYWDGPSEEVVYPWFLMKTASYFSAVQAAGMIFHRKTTFEALRRQAVIDGPGAPANRGILSRDEKLFKPLPPDGIIRVCRESGVDFVVSPLHYPALSTNDEWAPTPQSRYWLYDCAQINSKALSLPTHTTDNKSLSGAAVPLRSPLRSKKCPIVTSRGLKRNPSMC